MWLVWVDEWTGWQVNKLFVMWNRALQSRDRRPRLSAHLPLCVIPSGNIFSFWGAWGGLFWLCSGGQKGASFPTLWGYFCLKRAFLHIEETPFSSQGNALVVLRKRLLQCEESVPLILRSCYQYFCRVLAWIQVVVFTTLSIWRGDGSEAVYSRE